METIVTRKIFGRQISYNLAVEESPVNKQLHVSVECLQPKLFLQMLGNSPELFRNQLLQIATDAAYRLNIHSQFEGTGLLSFSDKDVSMRVRFSCR